ncbi:hypothetical protein WG902_14555 [Ramlibacter sp. PS3R-8]|uniref:hypothetical protein n=1 Tax=Ramlibacter sp. PS3R-8 TaxID=3133437 RepID=UPI0030A6044F
MPGPVLPARCAAMLLAAGLLLGGCDAPSAGEAQDTEQKLHGTWLRESNEAAIRARRILVLRPDGVFQETVRIVDAAGKATTQNHEGTWIYDGTNLKRKYTLMNGEPPSRLNLPFATFEIRFETRNEFVGVDHIHGNRIRYERVAADTQP